MLNILINDGIILKKVSNTNGGEYAGSCPFCGGKDRFRVWPEYHEGKYWCRQCNNHGDTIEYLRKIRGMSFLEAAKFTGKSITRSNAEKHSVKNKNIFVPKVSTVPSVAWQEQAREYLETFHDSLWSEQGKEALDFLHSRGLQDEMIKDVGIGFNCIDRFRDREAWGLPAEVKVNGKQKRLWLPSGITIPFFDRAGSIIRLRVRRFNPDDGNKYILIPGSDLRPMAFNPEAAVAVIVESELDAILLQQEVGDWCCIVALGSACCKPDSDTHHMLKNMETILISLDADDAGAKAAWSFWGDTYGDKARRWPTIQGKDPSEAMLNGLNLRAWVLAGLDLDEDKLERLCIQTVEGNLSDREAWQKKFNKCLKLLD
ncbi:MAG: hypothetical protein GX625_00520 [Clostridiaceae bacterium]|nr:hypothetical protein [Clostridiaceae bacterium]